MDHRSDIHCVLKVENHSNEPLNIRGIFSDAGEIPQLYPYDAGVLGQLHYFVEYQHRESIDCALYLGLGSSAGLRVYPIQSDPHLVEQFRSCKPYGASRQLSKEITSTARRPSASVPISTNYPKHEARNTGKRLLVGRSSDFGARDRLLKGQYGRRTPPEHPTSDSLSRQPSTSELPHICRTTSNLSTNTEVQPFLDTSPVSFSMHSRLAMNIQGQEIIYDLSKDPQQDPKVVIELLKLSSSERGNWMVAGAHFRRVGKPCAAIDVMYAMLEVLVNNGFTEAKLKPVFLLLSGCELDLAICAKNSGNSVGFQQHNNNMQIWLQKVYGTSPPSTLVEPPNSLLSSTVTLNRDPPEPPGSTHAIQPDSLPPIKGPALRNSPERVINRKRKMERNPSEERNVRRRHSGPPRLPPRRSSGGRFFGNKENWRRT
ncbi:hypothetical protein P691DRAFT_776319 [Macrolepiota fuliginosa MF-IS2]|uniref:Uncharacterized protein n=1 Tax=Macrolepiota fuliginosa MF-IS2 TaxID=1400762 RepID=A0A9P5X9Z9_9AGAR|nr:hypothetical protein P691DRAFT_776319 [Macrolepiota fuliginosa MF-IS2]